MKLFDIGKQNFKKITELYVKHVNNNVGNPCYRVIGLEKEIGIKYEIKFRLG